MKQNRLLSPVLWTSFIMFAINHFGLQYYLGLEATAFQTIIDSVIQILIVVGIVNDPTSKEKF